jgi:hypothetical protein
VHVIRNSPGSIVSPDLPSDLTLQKPVADPTDSYQKILDYHVAEILLTTIIFGIVILLRLYR